MRKHLHRWLNDEALRELGDEYEGKIASVTEEVIRNRFTAQRQLEPIIAFQDGWRLCPNITQRRALVEMFESSNTDEWIGQRLIVFRHRISKVDPKTGVVKEKFEKRVRLAMPHALRRHA